MVTHAVLLVGCCERDRRDDGTGFRVRLRPNVNSACAEAIMTEFKGSRLCGRVAVCESRRFIEVGGCRRHFDCAGGQGKCLEIKDIFPIEVLVFILVGARGALKFRAEDAIAGG